MDTFFFRFAQISINIEVDCAFLLPIHDAVIVYQISVFDYFFGVCVVDLHLLQKLLSYLTGDNPLGLSSLQRVSGGLCVHLAFK